MVLVLKVLLSHYSVPIKELTAQRGHTVAALARGKVSVTFSEFGVGRGGPWNTCIMGHHRVVFNPLSFYKQIQKYTNMEKVRPIYMCPYLATFSINLMWYGVAIVPAVLHICFLKRLLVLKRLCSLTSEPSSVSKHPLMLPELHTTQTTDTGPYRLAPLPCLRHQRNSYTDVLCWEKPRSHSFMFGNESLSWTKISCDE